MKRYKTHDFDLQELAAGVHEGRFQLPEFQRRFAWAPKARKELLESIQKGFPAGTLLMMEVQSADESPFGARIFEGAPEPTKAAEFLVLDGQQRIGTCYAALRAEGKSIWAID